MLISIEKNKQLNTDNNLLQLAGINKQKALQIQIRKGTVILAKSNIPGDCKMYAWLR